jgi:hypothetical protein
MFMTFGYNPELFDQYCNLKCYTVKVTVRKVQQVGEKVILSIDEDFDPIL